MNNQEAKHQRKNSSGTTDQDLLQKMLPTRKALKISGFPDGWTIFAGTQAEGQLL